MESERIQRPDDPQTEPVLVEGELLSLTQPQRKEPMSETSCTPAVLEGLVNALLKLNPRLDEKIVRLVGEVEGVEYLRFALKSMRTK